MTTSQGKEIIMGGCKASGIIKAVKKGSARLLSLNPFNDLDSLLIESPNTAGCFDISKLDEDQTLAFAARDEGNQSDEEEEDLYYPPDSDGNICDILIMMKHYNNFFR